jgi:hypothetical protein
MGELLGYLVKFNDAGKEPPVAQLYYPLTDEGFAQAEAFAREHDQKGFSIYSCIGKLRSAPRNKSNIAELDKVIIDLDLRNISEDRTQVLEVLRKLPLLPEIRDSGRGIHAVWHLKEPLIDDAGMMQAESVMRRLVSLLAGDPKPTHRAALLRHLGTHNSRDDSWKECRVLENGTACDISEFNDFFDLYNGTSLLHNKEGAANLFSSEGKRYPIDLEAMRWKGNPGIHDTFMGYMGSRLSHGDMLTEIIERVIEVAERNCADDPNKMNWRKDLAKMATWYLQKSPEFVDRTLDAEHAQQWMQALEAGRRPTVVWRNDHGIEVRAYSAGEKTNEGTPAGAAPANTGDAPPVKPKYRFKLVDSADMDLDDELPYLIDELFPINGIVAVWGPPKCLKSFLMLSAMYHVGMGWEFHGRAVHQGLVLYCAFEGGHGYRKRKAAWARHYNVSNDELRGRLLFLHGMANLINDHLALIREFKDQLAQNFNNAKPVAVVLDTLNKSLVGSESKDTDMTAYVRAAEAIRDAFNCVVIIVHHCGLDDTRPRGHTSLSGAVDAQIAVTREGMTVTAEVELMKDGPEGTLVVGHAKVIEVGHDRNGQILTSLAIEPVDKSDIPFRTTAKRRWQAGLKVLRDALDEALASAAVPHTIPDGPVVRAVDLEVVRNAFYQRYIVAGGETTREQQMDSKRKAFKRHVERAQAYRLIGAAQIGDRQLVWPTHEDDRDGRGLP